MAYYRSPVMAAQTYEESQGPDSPTEASPDELRAFYEDMERREILERKLSKRKSNSSTSIWSRKSLQRIPTAPPVHPNPGEFAQTPSAGNRLAGQGQVSTDAAAKAEERRENNGSAPQLTSSRSAFLDTKDAWGSVPLSTFKVKYQLHNPLGPRWYRNYHLIPPSQMKPSMRPPTFFSPSFPPMGSSSPMPDPNDEGSGPSRTPSHSSLPTPTSSQTRVADSMKPRSRKTSQTTPDTVDLLDVTDPWGTSWHHTSPYDFFGQTAVSSPEHQDAPTRTRRASMTTASRHMSVAPSPLSQSTSAVHLHGTQQEIHIPRKLSKRKTPTLGGLFGVTPQENRKFPSEPATPIDRIYLSDPAEIGDENSTSLPRRMSVAPAPSYPAAAQPQLPPTSKREKRGSVLNRLARKFSVLRKSADQPGHQTPYSVGKVDSWQNADTLGRPEPNHDFSQDIDSAFHKQQYSDLTNSTPPVPAPPQPEMPKAKDRRSIASLEEPYLVGRLTVANPDVSDSEHAPSIDEAPLPPEKPQEILQRRASHVDEPPEVLDPSDPEVESDQTAPAPPVVIPNRLDKPLPPPQPSTPEIILIHLADEPMPQRIETDLPALPVSSPAGEDESELMDSPLETETPSTTKSPSQAPASIRHTTLDSPSTMTERDQTQSPPPHRPASRDTQRSVLSPQATRSTSRRDSKIPDPTPTMKVHEPQKKPTKIASPSPPPAPSKPVRHSQKGRPHSRSHSSQVPPPANVPFPAQSTEALFKTEEPSYPYLSYADSPLTTSSMLANPPTPYNHRLSIAVSDVPPTLPPKSIYEEKREVLPPTHSSGRQTETFKLVRSSSGNVYASGDTIVAAGQQWEVVESVEGKRRKDKPSSKSKDYDQSGSLDPKPESRAKGDEINDHRRQSPSHRSSKRPHQYDEECSPTKVNVRTSTRHQEEKSYYDDREERKKYEEREERRRQDEREERRRQEDREQRKRKEERDERRRQEERAERRRQEEEREERKRQAEREERRRQEEEREERKRQAEREERRRQEEEREERKRQAEYEEHKKQEERRRQEEHKKQLEYEERRRQEQRKRQEERDERRRQEEYEERKKQEERSRREERKRREERSHREQKVRREEKSHHDERPRSDDRPRREERPRRHEYRQSRPVEEGDSMSDYRSINQPSINQPSANRQSTRSQTVLSHPPPDPPARLERNPSITARPTSELPSAAEMNAMRAKEAWEMERLWKARSMYGLEPNAPTNNFIPSPGSSSSKSDDTHTYGATYGSNHTAFMVQTPFQTHGSQIYHSMPTAPPPIIYSSPASIPSIPDSLSAYDPYEYPHSYRPHPNATLVNSRGPSSLSRPPLNNPLPEPPQESSYEPASLSAKPGTNWTKYTGITTTH